MNSRWCLIALQLEGSAQEGVNDLVLEVPLLSLEVEEELLSSHACVLVLFAETSDLVESWGGGGAGDEEEELRSLGLGHHPRL